MESAFVLELSDSKFKDLFICFCGYAQCEPLHSFGPAARPNYLLHYIIDGKGIYQTSNHTYHLGSGEGFLIEPGSLTFYQADKEHPWSYLWIGFSGRRAKEYLEDLGLNSNQLTFRSKHGKDLKRTILQMMRCSDNSITSQYRLQSLLYAFFATLSRNAQEEARESILQSPKNFYVDRAVTYIRNHYASGITVSDIANYLCLNRSYLYKLFQNSLHMSPQEFLTQFRLSIAKELLTTTQFPIEHVASSCGYQNTLVFSKAFKRTIGCTPSDYRVKHWKVTRQNFEENKEILGKLLNENSSETLH